MWKYQISLILVYLTSSVRCQDRIYKDLTHSQNPSTGATNPDMSIKLQNYRNYAESERLIQINEIEDPITLVRRFVIDDVMVVRSIRRLTTVLETSLISPDNSSVESLDTDMGTHLIAPCYIDPGQWCIPQIPLQRLFCQAVAIDARQFLAVDNASARITMDHLYNWEQKNGKITNGSIVLLLTGWSRHWNNSNVYKGSDSNNSADFIFPDLDIEAATWLVVNRSVIGIGIDTLSLERGNTTNVHSILAKHNVYAIENLVNLEYLKPFGSELVVMPISVDRVRMAPCRIVASISANKSFEFLPPPTTTTTTTTTATLKPTTIATTHSPTTNTIPSPTHRYENKPEEAANKKKPNAGSNLSPTFYAIFMLIALNFVVNK